jgi:hypothetical protein
MKRHFSITLTAILLVLRILLWGNMAYAAMEITIEGIMADKDSYDGKEVSVSGAVSSPRFKASKAGKLYMTFPLLGNSGGRINAFVWGDMKLKKEQKVKVTGIYRKIMKMGKYTFRDIIEASNVTKESTPTSILPHRGGG